MSGLPGDETGGHFACGASDERSRGRIGVGRRDRCSLVALHFVAALRSYALRCTAADELSSSYKLVRPRPADVVSSIVESVAADEKDGTRVLAVLCDNEAGVLSRVAGAAGVAIAAARGAASDAARRLWG
jgi:hypothetical protein